MAQLSEEVMGLLEWWKKQQAQAKRAPRYRSNRIVAYYWDGGTPHEHPVQDISGSGAYICAEEPWYAGTILTVTFRAFPLDGRTEPELASISVKCRVVRQGPDGGVGVVFMSQDPEQRQALDRFIRAAILKPHGRIRKDPGSRGQALIEYALIVPLIFLLIVNAVNFGYFFYTWIEVANAVRIGAQYAALNFASAGNLTPVSGATVAALVKNDMKSLPNTPSVSVCQNLGGTVTPLSGTCSGVPSDPESSALYVLTTVDVKYNYSPIIPVFQFPALGIYGTIPATSIHRRAVMRSIQ